MNSSLCLFKASQPEDPITLFTTGNTGPGLTFEVDSYALARVSVAEEIRQLSSAIRLVPSSIPQCH